MESWRLNFKAKIREGSVKSTKIAPRFISCCNEKGNNFLLSKQSFVTLFCAGYKTLQRGQERWMGFKVY